MGPFQDPEIAGLGRLGEIRLRQMSRPVPNLRSPIDLDMEPCASMSFVGTKRLLPQVPIRLRDGTSG